MMRTAQEMTCPQCGGHLAARTVNKKFVAAFNKHELSIWDPPGGPPYRMSDFKLDNVRHIKYRMLNRCRYCGHEWFSTKSERA